MSGPKPSRSVPPPPEVDGVVDGRPGMLGQDRVGDLGRKLDPDDRFQSGAVVEAPVDVERHAGPSQAGPEALHGDRVDPGEPSTEPAPERRPRRIVVDHERRAVATYDAGQLPEAWFTAGSEEVGPPRVHDVHRRVRERNLLRGA